MMAGFASCAACGPAFGLSLSDEHVALADRARRSVRGSRALRLMIPSGSEANVAPVTRRFTDLSGIPVDIDVVPNREVGTRVLLSKLSGSGTIDVALPATYDIPDLVAAKALLPLDALEKDARLGRAGDAAIYSEGDSFDGTTYGYQTDGDAYLLFMNRDFLENDRLLDAYEYAYGERFGPPGSWTALDRQVAFVSDFDSATFGGLLPRRPGYVEWEFWLRLHAKGVWPLSPDFKPQIAGDEGVAALEEMVAIDEKLAPDFGGSRGLFENWDQYARVPTYLTVGWGGTQKILSLPGNPLKGRLLQAAIPGGDGPGLPRSLPYFNWGWSYSVLADTAMPEAAHAFALFAVTPAISTEAVRAAQGYFDPFLAQHYDDPEIRNIYGDAFLHVHRISMNSAIPDFYIADRDRFFSVLGNWLGLALARVAQPDKALLQVALHWELLADASDRDRQARRWRELRAKYPREVAAHLRDLDS